MNIRKLWFGFITVMVLSFGVLGYFGIEIYHEAPPIPDQVVTNDGTVLFTGQDIRDGQNVWQSIGGQQLGTVWGHGAYVAPDWSADWLHRESSWLLDHWATQRYGKTYEALDGEAQAALRVKLQTELRTNTYDPASGDLKVSVDRAAAIAAVSNHYAGLFGDAPEEAHLREAYAIPPHTLKEASRQAKMNAFFFWVSW